MKISHVCVMWHNISIHSLFSSKVTSRFMNYFPSSTPLLAPDLILVPTAAITSQLGQQRLAILGAFFIVRHSTETHYNIDNLDFVKIKWICPNEDPLSHWKDFQITCLMAKNVYYTLGVLYAFWESPAHPAQSYDHQKQGQGRLVMRISYQGGSSLSCEQTCPQNPLHFLPSGPQHHWQE